MWIYILQISNSKYFSINTFQQILFNKFFWQKISCNDKSNSTSKNDSIIQKKETKRKLILLFAKVYSKYYYFILLYLFIFWI